MANKKLFLLDGHALVYRAHYAFITRPLINSKGMNTSAVSGFVRVVWDLIRNQKPSHLAVSFDMSGPTFRHEMYEEYKANRDAQPEDITVAIPIIKTILEAWKIPIVTKQGYEADDLIGTIAHKAAKEDFDVYMVTPDKDYAQLVTEKIFMYKPSRMGNGVEILGVEEVLEKWQISRIDQVIDFLALKGDAVDNIPGIPGIGDKTAVKLLKEFNSVEELIERADEVKGKLSEKIKLNAEQGLLSKKLATIDIDCPVEFSDSDYELVTPNLDKLNQIFVDLEFRTLAKTIIGHFKKDKSQQLDLFGNQVAVEEESVVKPIQMASNNISNVEHNYQLIQGIDACTQLAKQLDSQTVFCFDTETTGVNPHLAELVGISFSWKSGEAYYVPVPLSGNEKDVILNIFKPIFENENIAKVGQNLKYDALILKWLNIELKGKLFDTLLAHYLVEPDLRHNMDYLSETYLNYKPVSIETLIGKRGKNQLNMSQVPVEKVSDYAAEDADITWQLKEHLQPWLEKEELIKLYDEIEEPTLKALIQMEYNGVKIDSEKLKKQSERLQISLKEIEKEIFELSGDPFNILSPKQLGLVLFEKLEIPYRWKKTKTGQYSTDEEKLSELAENHPIVAQVLKYRSYKKLQGTYLDALPKLVNPNSGLIHSSFNQWTASTGRLSSNDPNLQNIPVRTEEGAKIREAFVPRHPDNVIFAADYSQIELRLIAEMSGDEAMLSAFNDGLDIHTATAARVFGVELDEVTRLQRYQAKTVNFSIIYGAGATNLSKQLDIKRAEAKKLIDQYFSEYKGLKTYMDKVVEDARNEGYVSTMKGRKRKLKDINSRNGMIRSHAERNAVNSPIQGSAADMIKIAMADIHQEMMKRNMEAKMILQVHDELVFDVPKSELEELKEMVVEKMKKALPDLKVPIVVGVDVGDNWLEAH